jgi:hypothetical protein
VLILKDTYIANCLPLHIQYDPTCLIYGFYLLKPLNWHVIYTLHIIQGSFGNPTFITALISDSQRLETLFFKGPLSMEKEIFMTFGPWTFFPPIIVYSTPFFFFFRRIFWIFQYFIQHCFICLPSDATVPVRWMLGSNPGQLRLRNWLHIIYWQ